MAAIKNREQKLNEIKNVSNIELTRLKSKISTYIYGTNDLYNLCFKNENDKENGICQFTALIASIIDQTKSLNDTIDELLLKVKTYEVTQQSETLASDQFNSSSSCEYSELSADTKFNIEIQKQDTSITEPKENQIKLTAEAEALLEMKPMKREDVLKELIGYIPKDDERICRFYNPKTGGCFKGSACRKRHTLRVADGCTKDLELTKAIPNHHMMQRTFSKHDELNITVTHIKSETSFYAQVNGSQPHVPLIWTYDELPAQKHLDNVSHILQYVLVKYGDDLYYRAQIMEIIDNDFYKVFYIDYGNEDIIELKDLAECDEFTAFMEPQAHLMFIDGIKINPLATNEQKNHAMGYLNKLLLNKTLNVKVIDSHHDIKVELLEHHFKFIPLQLTLFKCVKLNENDHTH